MRPILIATSLALLALFTSPLRADIMLGVQYVQQVVPPPPTLSRLDPAPEEAGRDGARLGLAENTTTGRFLKHTYTLDFAQAHEDEAVIAAARAALEQSPFLLIDAPAAMLQRIADLPEAAGAVLFNVSAPDDILRSDGCRANLLHTALSRRMRTDALMQFLVARRWRKLALVNGTFAADAAFVDALVASATKFGMQIGAHKVWVFDADMRRAAAAEVPLFTQDLGGYDVLLVADEYGDFARYLPFNTWLPRPVAGSEGLVPVAWSGVIEQWGAAQLQTRFTDLAGRPMTDVDYAAWAAMRALGEAVIRTNSADPAVLRSYLMSDAFELGGFKGRPLSFRHWNGQLRQPVALVTARAQVVSAPLEGFLHQRSELDTLGLDAPESSCAAYEQ